jgi:hypothetical protein
MLATSTLQLAVDWPVLFEITMWDKCVAPNPGNKIGFVAHTNVNDSNALHMTSKLDSHSGTEAKLHPVQNRRAQFHEHK